MKAAEELFRTRRVDEVTLDEIARQADVGKGDYFFLPNRMSMWVVNRSNGMLRLKASMTQSR